MFTRTRTTLLALAATVGLLTTGVAGAAYSVGQTSDAPVQPQIVDGEPATVNPGLISLGPTRGGHNCTGSIIAPTWVLTADHCVNRNTASGSVVRYGELEYARGRVARIKKVHTTSGKDMALLELEQPVTGTYIVKLTDVEPQQDEELTQWGWGRTSGNGPASPVLKFAKVRMNGFSRDGRRGKALDLRGVTGTAWKGDSGGPAFTKYGDQVGVCSTGSYTRKQANYTSVAEYRSWIRQVSGV